MYVLCNKCEDVYSIFECKKVWSNNHTERFPKYECDTCRNVIKDTLSKPETGKIYAI